MLMMQSFFTNSDRLFTRLSQGSDGQPGDAGPIGPMVCGSMCVSARARVRGCVGGWVCGCGCRGVNVSVCLCANVKKMSEMFYCT